MTHPLLGLNVEFAVFYEHAAELGMASHCRCMERGAAKLSRAQMNGTGRKEEAATSLIPRQSHAAPAQMASEAAAQSPRWMACIPHLFRNNRAWQRVWHNEEVLGRSVGLIVETGLLVLLVAIASFPCTKTQSI